MFPIKAGSTVVCKSKLEEPVARDITSQLGTYTLMHSWRLQCSCFSSCTISAGMVQQNRHPFTAIQTHMSRLTPFSYFAAAGALHTHVQPVIRMSLKLPPSLLRLVILFNPPQQKFLCSFTFCRFSLETSSSFCLPLFRTWDREMTSGMSQSVCV